METDRLIMTPFGQLPQRVVELATDQATGLVDVSALTQFSQGQTRLEGHNPNAAPQRPSPANVRAGSQSARRVV